MGIGGFVNCRCYQDGKTSEPPYKEYLRIDNEGIWFEAYEFWKENPPDLAREMDDECEKWLESACVHKDMQLVFYSKIAVGTVHHFLRLLGGEELFPVLNKYLPELSGGHLPAEFAQNALDELEHLKSIVPKETAFIVNKKTGKTVRCHHTMTYAAFSSSQCSLTVGKQGFCIFNKSLWNVKDANPEDIVFTSMNFIEEYLDESQVKFTDIPTGKTFECNSRVCDYFDEDSLIKESPPQVVEYEVLIKNVSIDEEYDDVFPPFQKLFAASIESGNPVVWW